MNKHTETNPSTASVELEELIQAIGKLAEGQAQLLETQKVILQSQKELLSRTTTLLNDQRTIQYRQMGIHTPYWTKDWFSQNIPVWQALLAPYQGQKNLRFLEIGSFQGRSATWLLQNILVDPTTQIHCIDPFHWPEATREIFAYNMQPFAERVVMHVGSSQDILPTLTPDHFDVIYVDGDHRANNAYLDAAMSWPLLKENGLMIFDDYEWTGEDTPKAGIDRFLQEKEGQHELLHKAYQVAIRKQKS
jgi:predicted O-methyltransferase YrrM